MSKILSHPFRLIANGTIATVEQESERADVEQVAVLALTRLGERPLVPSFGVSDPVFARFDVGQLAAGLAAYGPPVTIRSAVSRPVSDTEEVVEVIFDS